MKFTIWKGILCILIFWAMSFGVWMAGRYSVERFQFKCALPNEMILDHPSIQVHYHKAVDNCSEYPTNCGCYVCGGHTDPKKCRICEAIVYPLPDFRDSNDSIDWRKP
jgi:hypothetical protein